MLTVTLNAIHPLGLYEEGWVKLLNYLGKVDADDEPLSLLTILDSNGLDDTLWCLRALGPEWDPWVRLTACDLVEPAMKFTTDPRPQAALDTARRFAHGEATGNELAAAEAAASAAAEAAIAGGRTWPAWAPATGWRVVDGPAWAAWAARAAVKGAISGAGYAAVKAAGSAGHAALVEQERIFRDAIAKLGD